MRTVAAHMVKVGDALAGAVPGTHVTVLDVDDRRDRGYIRITFADGAGVVTEDVSTMADVDLVTV